MNVFVPRTEKERLRRNEGLLPHIMVALELSEREWIIERLRAVPRSVRMISEDALLTKLLKNRGQQPQPLRIEGWERAWVMDRISRKAQTQSQKQLRQELLNKMRG